MLFRNTFKKIEYHKVNRYILDISLCEHISRTYFKKIYSPMWSIIGSSIGEQNPANNSNLPTRFVPRVGIENSFLSLQISANLTNPVKVEFELLPPLYSWKMKVIISNEVSFICSLQKWALCSTYRLYLQIIYYLNWENNLSVGQ